MTAPTAPAGNNEPPCWVAPLLFLMTLVGLSAANYGFATGLWFLDALVALVGALVFIACGVGMAFLAIAVPSNRLVSCLALVLCVILLMAMGAQIPIQQKEDQAAMDEYNAKMEAGDYAGAGAEPQSKVVATAGGCVVAVCFIPFFCIQVVTGKSALWFCQSIPEVEGQE